MATMVKLHECFEETLPIMDVIRQLDPESMLPCDDRRLAELESIRDSALENDYALAELIRLKPEMESVYRKQWETAEEDLDRRAAKLGIKTL